MDDDARPTVADAGADVTGTEGAAVAIKGTGGGTGDAGRRGPSRGCTIAAPSSLTTTVTCSDETTATLTLTAADGTHPAATDTAVLTVGNAPRPW